MAQRNFKRVVMAIEVHSFNSSVDAGLPEGRGETAENRPFLLSGWRKHDVVLTLPLKTKKRGRGRQRSR